MEWYTPIGIVVCLAIAFYIMYQDWVRPLDEDLEPVESGELTDIERVDYAQFRLRQAIQDAKHLPDSPGKTWYLEFLETKAKEAEAKQFLHTQEKNK